MVSMKLGSKSEAFYREGNTWLCTTGLPSDITIEIGEMTCLLHKFPMLSRSGLLKNLIEEKSSGDVSNCILQLDDVPGGAKAFELVTKFCYDVKIEITAADVVGLRSAAEYFQMTEEYAEENLISRTEAFLDEVFGSWTDSIKALETCEDVPSYAEDLHIVSRCIDSLAVKACSDPNLFNWPVTAARNGSQNPSDSALWNGISSELTQEPLCDDWWYEDVSLLSLPLFKRLILAIESKGMRPESISSSLIYYAKKFIPLMNRQFNFDDTKQGIAISKLSEADQRALLEEIVTLLPSERGITSSRNLLRLLRTSMILHASSSCIEILEKRIGAQLDQAVLLDILIPNIGFSVEPLYDIDCFQRILDHFMIIYNPTSVSSSPGIIEEGQLMTNDTLTPMTMVANLVDGYLAEVASDVNLKLSKFQALAAAIPGYARPLDDGLYQAIDVYLKTHPWLTDAERETLCRLMNCQRLSLEASTHAAQNERLPLRLIVQVLFFEQLRLRTSISGWFFVSENLENSQNPSGNLGGAKGDERLLGGDNMRERVKELEKVCSNMRMELQKLVKTKKSWSFFPKKLSLRKKSECCKPKESNPCDTKPPSSKTNEKSGLDNGPVVH